VTTTDSTLFTSNENKQNRRPTVFISYSHKDQQEKDNLLVQLGVLERVGLIET
jgi:hypothetical protein